MPDSVSWLWRLLCRSLAGCDVMTVAAVLPEPSACIRCGRCIEACPMGLEPVEVVSAFNNKDFDTLKARCVDLCVACGSCTYACPAKRPVSQTMTLAKAWYLGELRKGGK